MKFTEIKTLHENQKVIDKLEDKKFDLERALDDARDITKTIKYADMHVDIITNISTLAEKHGIEIDEYQERKVFEAKNKLESEIYELEEVFKEAIRDIDNKIDELGYED
ncbi:hypothetical protein N9J02_00625 [bacterium]|jgi:hypothetical protein|nr:hypothetical protein [bacterium]